MEKTITINGERHVAHPFSLANLEPGAILRLREGRNVYKLLCYDNGEAVLRAVRHPSKFETWPIGNLERDFFLVI